MSKKRKQILIAGCIVGIAYYMFPYEVVTSAILGIALGVGIFYITRNI
jgi:hypothetical protein